MLYKTHRRTSDNTMSQNQQGQTMLYKTHRRTSDNTMAKTNKDKQCYTKHIEERQTIPWPKPTRTNNVIQNTSKNVRQYHGQNQQGQTMLYKTHRRTSDNTMAKTNKDKQCYTKHIVERQTIPWPKPTRTNNMQNTYKTMLYTSKNVRQYHGQNQQGQTMLYKTHRRTSDNTMAKTKQGQTMLYKTHRRTSDNTMAKTNNGQTRQGQTM